MSGIAERVVRSGYAVVFRSVFANMDPERAHHIAFAVIKTLPH
ncbi:dihydroorotate dehydrogenase (quinone), partial [Bacillus sp. S34]|nr:dihydroorotate dehydrogenase (quinone) [Bacillus sp. S34]